MIAKNKKVKMQKFVLLFLLNVFSSMKAEKVACEKVYGVYWDWADSMGFVNVCRMDVWTRIDKENVTISSSQRDITVAGLTFKDNRKVSNLPVRVAEIFPKLKFFAAQACSIKKVSKANFEGLNDLKVLALRDNSIEMIPSDLFEGLHKLEYIELSKKVFEIETINNNLNSSADNNKIKFFNGATIHGLNRLKNLLLESNECIDQTFRHFTEIATAQQTINEKCSFNELKLKDAAAKFQINALELMLERSKSEVERIKTELKALKSQNSHLLTDENLVELEEEIKSD